ncbi:MAG: response regulator [Lentisphaeria bacterium]|nr:response regulator [Lentisphaeria bacterium]
MERVSLPEFGGEGMGEQVECVQTDGGGGNPAYPVLDVLVVDDNYMIRDIIGRAVKLLIPGCRCHVCACGQDALDAIRRNHCHLAFLDLSMPDMTGFDLAREIRAGEKEAGKSPIPLVAISAYSPEQEWQTCQGNGFSAFLQKPFGKQELKSCLANVLPALAENP